jgi:hypothetical protein
MSSNHTQWTPQLVAEHFEEAVGTSRKLPAVTVQGYFNSLPDIVHTPNELMLMEARPTKVKARPDEISRLEQSLEWMRWLTVKERKLIWRRAAKTPWKRICCDLGYVRMTVWRKWVCALTKISTQLNIKHR